MERRVLYRFRSDVTVRLVGSGFDGDERSDRYQLRLRYQTNFFLPGVCRLHMVGSADTCFQKVSIRCQTRKMAKLGAGDGCVVGKERDGRAAQAGWTEARSQIPESPNPKVCHLSASRHKFQVAFGGRCEVVLRCLRGLLGVSQDVSL